MELVKITHVQHRLIRNLSKGYKQRVGLAQALVGAPEVLFWTSLPWDLTRNRL